MNGRPRSPLHVMLNITRVCNLRCQYCYMQPLAGDHMGDGDFERVVDELSEQQIFKLCIAGGEPFAHPQLGAFLQKACSRFPHVTVLTNGTILKEQHEQVIARLIREGASLTFQVSVDAFNPETNSLTRTRSMKPLKTVQRLRELGMQVAIAMVVTRFNISDVLPSITELLSLTPYFHLIPVQEPRQGNPVLANLAVSQPRLEKLWTDAAQFAMQHHVFINTPRSSLSGGCATGAPCQAGFTYLVIDPNLDVRPCDRLTDCVIGNLREKRISEIWNSPQVISLLRLPMPACRATRPGDFVAGEDEDGASFGTLASGKLRGQPLTGCCPKPV
jgi:MoaA/NifB/PqqE/SkfB family radical SAM enzyme